MNGIIWYRLPVVILVLLSTLSGCRIILKVGEGGSVDTTVGGTINDCPANSTCIIDPENPGYTTSIYSDAYRARPAPGYVFGGWDPRQRSLCSRTVARCEITVTPDVIEFFPDSDATVAPYFRRLARIATSSIAGDEQYPLNLLEVKFGGGTLRDREDSCNTNMYFHGVDFAKIKYETLESVILQQHTFAIQGVIRDTGCSPETFRLTDGLETGFNTKGETLSSYFPWRDFNSGRNGIKESAILTESGYFGLVKKAVAAPMLISNATYYGNQCAYGDSNCTSCAQLAEQDDITVLPWCGDPLQEGSVLRESEVHGQVDIQPRTINVDLFALENRSAAVSVHTGLTEMSRKTHRSGETDKAVTLSFAMDETSARLNITRGDCSKNGLSTGQSDTLWTFARLSQKLSRSVDQDKPQHAIAIWESYVNGSSPNVAQTTDSLEVIWKPAYGSSTSIEFDTPVPDRYLLRQGGCTGLVTLERLPETEDKVGGAFNIRSSIVPYQGLISSSLDVMVAARQPTSEQQDLLIGMKRNTAPDLTGREYIINGLLFTEPSTSYGVKGIGVGRYSTPKITFETDRRGTIRTGVTVTVQQAQDNTFPKSEQRRQIVPFSYSVSDAGAIILTLDGMDTGMPLTEFIGGYASEDSNTVLFSQALSSVPSQASLLGGMGIWLGQCINCQ